MSESICWGLLVIFVMFFILMLTAKRIATMSPKFHWEADEWGVANRALHFGGLYVGEIHHFKSRTDGEMPWRAWVQTSTDGDEVGWFATEHEARIALMNKVQYAISE